MKNWMFCLLVLASATIGANESTEVAANPAWDSYEGVWESSYGHLFFTYRTNQAELPFTADGKGIRAAFWSYPDSHGKADNGRIIGTVKGRNLSGYWIQDSGDNPCAEEKDGSLYWGIVRFEANADYSELEGVWGLCDQEPEGDDIDWLLWRDELRNWDPAQEG